MSPRRLIPILALALVAAPRLDAKKARVRRQDAKPSPLVTVTVDPGDGPEALKEALREAGKAGSVRVVTLATPPLSGTARPLAAAPATPYRPADVQVSNPAWDAGQLFVFHAEPSIAAQGDAVVCVYNDGGTDAGSPHPVGITSSDGFAISADRGGSWQDQGRRSPAGAFTSFDGDNVVAAGPDGDFYYLSDGGVSGRRWSAMSVSRSTDGGVTWTNPTSPSAGVAGRADGFFDKGWIAVDRSSTPTRGTVYVTWSDFGTSATDLWVARSTDHGASWSAQRLDTFNHPVSVTYVQVAPNGLVYVGEQDEGTVVNGRFTGTDYVRVSADGGKTYGPLRTAGSYEAVGDAKAIALCGDPTFFGGLVRYLNGPIEADSSLRIAVDPSDASGQTVFVTTQGVPATPGDASDILLWRSTDGGLTWGDAVRVNDDTTKTDQFMPDLWVAPDGTVGVLWLDRRNDPKANWRLEAWMALSKDHGRTFGCSFPVSSGAFPPVGRCQMSDYNGVFADDRGFHLAWGDSRQTDPLHQLAFTIRGATVPLDGPGPLLFLDAIREEAPGRFVVSLRNDGTAGATGLSVSIAVDGNEILAATKLERFPDVPSCHGVSSLKMDVPYATARAWVSGTVSVTGPAGTAAFPFALPKRDALPAGVLLAADFESGTGDFTPDAGSLWHATKTCAATAPGHGGAGAAFFGSDTTCGWLTGTRLMGSLTSRAVSLPPGGATLTFREYTGFLRWGSDRAMLQISTDGGASFENLWGWGYMSRYVLDPQTPLTDASGSTSWHDVALDLSDYAGHDVILRFFAYVGARAGKGWGIDDVRLASLSTVPLGAPLTCAAPQEIASGTLTVDGAPSSGAPVPSCASGAPRRTAWFTFTPPVDGTYQFSGCTTTNGGATLSAWSGASCGTLQPLACGALPPCALPSVPPPITVTGTAGVPIRLLVSSAADADLRARLSATPLASGQVVPVVLDVPTATAHYTTELALTNHAAAPAAVTLAYTPSLGSGAASAHVTVEPGRVFRAEDVVATLRAAGAQIPSSGPQAGTLRVVADGVPAAALTAVARTVTPAGNGTASLSYGAVPMDGAGRTTVFGLRASARDRSKVAVFNPSASPATYRLTVVSGSGDGRRAVVREGETLASGAWAQLDGVLDEAGVTNGWAVVERLSTTGAVAAYGVVNDNVTNDGSYLPPIDPASSATLLTVPVLVETPRFTTELVLANQGSADARLTLSYRESLDGAGGGASFPLTLPKGTQRIVENAFALLRQNGATIGPAGRSYAGALRVTVEGAAAGDVFVAARASAPAAAGGAYGLFVPAVPRGAEADLAATVDGLRADAANRSNVAVVNAGDDTAGDVTLTLQAFDGASGAAAGAPLTLTLPPGGWAQPQDFFAAAGVASGWVRVTRVAGTAPWVAYGVVNDGGVPGQRTDDGAYVAMTR